MCPVMIRWLGILIRTLRSAVRTHRELALENLALRQQLAVWKARQPRPRLAATDRIFRVMLSVRTTCRSCAQVARARRVQLIGGGWGARRRASFFHRREDGSALGLQQHHDEPGRNVCPALSV